MKKNAKSTLSVLLAMVMILSMVTVSFASVGENGKEEYNTEEKASAIVDFLDQLIMENISMYMNTNYLSGTLVMQISNTELTFSSLLSLKTAMGSSLVRPQIGWMLPACYGDLVGIIQGLDMSSLGTSASSYKKRADGDTQMVTALYDLILNNYNGILQALDVVLSDLSGLEVLLGIGLDLPDDLDIPKLYNNTDTKLTELIDSFAPVLLELLGDLLDDLLGAGTTQAVKDAIAESGSAMGALEALYDEKKEDLFGFLDELVYGNQALQGTIFANLDLSVFDADTSLTAFVTTILNQVYGSGDYDGKALSDLSIKDLTDLLYCVLSNNGSTYDPSVYIDLLYLLFDFSETRGPLTINANDTYVINSSGVIETDMPNNTNNAHDNKNTVYVKNTGSGVHGTYDTVIDDIYITVGGNRNVVTFTAKKYVDGNTVKAGSIGAYYITGPIAAEYRNLPATVTVKYHYAGETASYEATAMTSFAVKPTQAASAAAVNNVRFGVTESNVDAPVGYPFSTNMLVVHTSNKSSGMQNTRTFVAPSELQWNNPATGAWEDCPWASFNLTSEPSNADEIAKALTGTLPEGTRAGTTYQMRARVGTRTSANADIDYTDWVPFTITAFDDGGLNDLLDSLTKFDPQESDYGATELSTYKQALQTAFALVKSFPKSSDAPAYAAAKAALENAHTALLQSAVSHDASSVQSAINAAQPKTQDAQYTTSSRADLQAAIDKASAIIADTPLTAYDVRNALTTVTYADSQLIQTADSSALTAALERAQAIGSSYTEASLQAVRAALKEATAILARAHDIAASSQHILADAAAALNSAIDALQADENAPDLGRLDALYRFGIQLPRAPQDYSGVDFLPEEDFKDTYGFFTWRALQSALEAADGLFEVSTRSLKDLDTVTNNLYDALDAMLNWADVSTLKQILASVPGDLSEYLEESVQALQEVLDEIGDPDTYIYPRSRQSTITALEEKLQTAIDHLVFPEIDWSAMEEQLTRFEGLQADEAKYTQASWKTANDAYTAAKEFYDTNKDDSELDPSNQTEINRLANALRDAVDGLKLLANYAALNTLVADFKTDYLESTGAYYGTYETGPAEDFIDAINWQFDADQQTTVDGYVTALTEIIANLQLAGLGNYDAVNAQITRLAGLKATGHYKDGIFDEIDAYITAINREILEANQSQIDAIAAELMQKIDAVANDRSNLKDADYSALAALYTTFQADYLTQGGQYYGLYVEAGLNAVTALYNGFDKTLKIDEQEKISGFITQLQSQIDGLILKAASETHIRLAKAAIDLFNSDYVGNPDYNEAAIKDISNFIEEFLKRFENNDVGNAKITDETAIEAFVEDINTKIEALVQNKADYTALDRLIKQYQDTYKDSDWYTDVAKQAVDALIAEIEKNLDRDLPLSQQNVVNGYVTRLEKAVQDLLDSLKPASTDALEALLKEIAEKYDKAEYTEASWNGLQTLLEQAKQLLARDLTIDQQQELDTMAAQIQDYLKNDLVGKKPVDPTDPTDTTDPEDPTRPTRPSRPSGSNNVQSPKTGDRYFSVLLLIAIAGAGAIFVSRKKRETD